MTPYFDGALIKRRAQGLDKRDRSTTKDGDLKASINSLIQLLCQRDCNNKKTLTNSLAAAEMDLYRLC